MSKLTPMMEQYYRIKQEVPDALLFFRLGDFYEMFFEDAIQASQELEITLTGRGKDTEDRIPMCGVPHHAAEQYITRLVAKGYKVAICEQTEDPAQAKGVVRREIVRIVTPGTVMEEKSLGQKINNFIVALAGEGTMYGLLACDLSTGEMYHTAVDHSLEALLDEAQVYAPAELLVTDAIHADFQHIVEAAFPGTVITARTQPTDQEFEIGAAAQDTDEKQRLIAERRRQGLSAVGQRAHDLLFDYLQSTQKRSLRHLIQIQTYEAQHYMILDPFTRRNLELTETIREGGIRGSLLWLLDETATAMGARMLRRWIDKPLMNRSRIERRLEAVSVLVGDRLLRDDLRESLKQVYDLERLSGRIAYGSANARDLIALLRSLRQVPSLFERCEASGSATLHTLVTAADRCDDLADWIEQALVEEPPISTKEGGMIRSGYHAYLDQLREASVNGKRWIAELEQQERQVTGIRSLKVGFNKVFGYYIEVTRSNLHALPEGRYERKQTMTNAERFITQELKEKEALILEADEKMAGLEYELFTELRERLQTEVARLQRLAERVCMIDVLHAFARVSAARHYNKPELSDGYDLHVRSGRHPVIEAVSPDRSFISNHSEFTEDEQRMLLITGPNMAGKSTYMRQVAMICIMAQIGCFVPAEKANLPLIDRIFTRIGAADDLVSGYSTFMIEMRDIQVMTAKATRRSLVIIDELGRGTSTSEGMAIAQAVIEDLHDRIGSKALVSTHFHELAHLEASLAYLSNYCMAVKESGDDVTFLRKLVRGAASTSYGIYCARLAGLPEGIIDRAYDLLTHLDNKPSPEIQQPAVLAEAPTAYEKPDDSALAVHAVVPTETVDDTDQTSQSEIVQLSLFAEEQAGKKSRSGGRQTAKSEAWAHEIEQLDLMNMTPLQAMQFLNELKQRIRER